MTTPPGSLCGIPVVLDHAVEPGTVELRDGETVVGKIVNLVISPLEEERLLRLWVTMPNYVRIVYGYVPPWHWTRSKP